MLNSFVVGALFALVAGPRVDSYLPAAAWGALWGVAWWVLRALILMPVLLGMPPFAALRMAARRQVALGSLIGHLIYSVILGLVYVRLRSPDPLAGIRAERAA